jgi:PX domain
MATFIRRKITRWTTRDTTPPSLTVTRPEGSIIFTKKEVQRYSQLLTLLDSDADEQLGGAEGAMFLRRSGLTTDQLREVWRLASGGTSKAKLSKEDWLIACKLVAVVQHKGLEPSLVAITGIDPLPLADFFYDSDANVDVDGLAEIPAGSIGVRVATPTSFGSGINKHTRYNVITTTSLAHFPRKDMSVWRRYSDFEWLHKRISTTYPAAMIPLFPEKKLIGNTDEGFVMERAAALETYLNKVAAHPQLSTSVDLLVFLDGTDQGLEASRLFIEGVEADDKESLLALASDMVTSITQRASGSASSAATGGTGAGVGGSAHDGDAKLLLKADEAYSQVRFVPPALSAVLLCLFCVLISMLLSRHFSLQGCSQHAASLARLNQAVKSAQALEQAEHNLATETATLAKALLSLSDHERRHASAGLSAAAAVAAAAAASRRAQEALFTGSAASTASSSADKAAAAAFASHSAAASVDTSSSISAMFEAADFNDPYSSLHNAAPGTSSVFGKAGGATGGASSSASSVPTGPGAYAEGLPDLLTAAGIALSRASARKHESLASLEAVWLKQLKLERESEGELGEAIRRRETAVDRVQEANASLQRKKRAMASLKPTSADFAAKSAEANAAVERADRELATARETLDKMTEVLKLEMNRTTQQQRRNLASHLAAYAQLHAAQARSEAELWTSLLSSISNDSSAIDASKENVNSVARKAEAKARAAMTAAAASKPAKGAANATAMAGAYGSGNAGLDGSGAAATSTPDNTPMPTFGDEGAPMPSSADDV